MDNKEFAKVLLSEASELLNESTRYDKELSKRAGYTSSKKYGNIAAKHIAKACDSKNKLDRAAEIAKSISATSTGAHIKELNKETLDHMDDFGDFPDDEGLRKYKLHNMISSPSDKGVKFDLEVYKNHKDTRKKSQNESIAVLLTEAAQLLNEGIFFNKNKKSKLDKVKVDYLTKFNDPKSWNKIKNKIAYYEYTGKDLLIYPSKWSELLSSYYSEISKVLKSILDSKDLDKDNEKILVTIGVIKNKYSKKLQDLIKEINSNTEWKTVMSFTDGIERFIKDLHDEDKCLMYLVDSNESFARKAKENSIVRKFDSEITSITELFYGEIISKICHAIRIAHE